MYDRPSNRAAHDALWALIRDGLRDRNIAAPDNLNRAIDHHTGWAAPDLVLGHICNLPYRATFQNRVTLIGASDYGLPNCAPGDYASVIIVHKDAPEIPAAAYANARFAVNEIPSESGYGAAQRWAHNHGFQFHNCHVSGTHDASLAAVANGRASIASIDTQTWWMQCQDTPDTDAVRIIGHTPTSPGQSFITRAGQDPAHYFAAISEAISALPTAHRTRLGLRGIVALPASAYAFPLPATAAPREAIPA